MPTTFQYNGLVLLYAYLQRAYVHHRTLDLLAAPADLRAAQQRRPCWTASAVR